MSVCLLYQFSAILNVFHHLNNRSIRKQSKLTKPKKPKYPYISSIYSPFHLKKKVYRPAPFQLHPKEDYENFEFGTGEQCINTNCFRRKLGGIKVNRLAFSDDSAVLLRSPHESTC